MQEGEEVCEALPRKEVADIVEGEGTHLRRTVSRVLGLFMGWNVSCLGFRKGSRHSRGRGHASAAYGLKHLVGVGYRELLLRVSYLGKYC